MNCVVGYVLFFLKSIKKLENVLLFSSFLLLLQWKCNVCDVHVLLFATYK